jgi:flagellin-like protein
MKPRIFRSRRGFSETISSVILTAVVISIGLATWQFAKGSTALIAQDYTNGVMAQTDDFLERYCINKIHYDEANNTLYLYIYNYGSITITVDSYISLSSGPSYSSIGVTIPPNHLVDVGYHIFIPQDTWVNITCQTRRSMTINDRYCLS